VDAQFQGTVIDERQDVEEDHVTDEDTSGDEYCLLDNEQATNIQVCSVNIFVYIQ